MAATRGLALTQVRDEVRRLTLSVAAVCVTFAITADALRAPQVALVVVAFMLGWTQLVGL